MDFGLKMLMRRDLLGEWTELACLVGKEGRGSSEVMSDALLFVVLHGLSGQGKFLWVECLESTLV